MSVIHTQIGHVGRRGRAFRQEDKHTACHGPGAAMHASSTNTACGARRLLVKWRRGRPWTRNGECVLVRRISLCVLGPPRPPAPKTERTYLIRDGVPRSLPAPTLAGKDIVSASAVAEGGVFSTTP